MNKIFGARARVLIKYASGIRELADKIKGGLMLPSLEVDHSEYEPYELIGMGEVMGFQIWLNGVEPTYQNIVTGYNFELEISTGMCHEEIMNDRMYDLSLWLARFVSVMCHIDVCVVGTEGGPVFFSPTGSSPINS